MGHRPCYQVSATTSSTGRELNRLGAVIENQGQCHYKGHGHLVGKDHMGLRSLSGWWPIGRWPYHQVTAITSSTGRELYADLVQSLKIKVNVIIEVKIV